MTEPKENQNHQSAGGHTENESSSEGEGDSFKLRLFVTGTSQRSQKAIQNIKQICEDHLQGKYELEIIDLYEDPDLARQYEILAVPTLLKELPPPLRKVIGDLSEEDEVLAGLDLTPK